LLNHFTFAITNYE